MSDDKPDAGAKTPKTDPNNPGSGEPKSDWAAKGEAAELEALRAEAADLKDRLLRTMAEMENLRRRTEREKSDTAKYAISSFARDVLTMGDNLRRAIEAVPQEALAEDEPLKYLLDGVQVTERELLNVLERHGIKRIEPKGERFDPNLHQAMLEVENKDVPAGLVADVLQPGYVIEDRVLRPAMVSVTKGGPKLPREDKEPQGSRAANNNTRAGDAGDGSEPPDEDGPPVGGRVDRSA